MEQQGYLARLRGVIAQHGPLCVGIDPHPHLLQAWGLPEDASGLERFGRTVVEALAGTVGIFKPQSAFFEPFGSAGVAVLERVLADIAQAGAISILDVKRGDIGTSMQGYARAHLVPGAPLASDAITLSPYLGLGSLRPAIDLARQHGRGLYVLARTSNPEGDPVQLATGPDGTTVAQQIVDGAQAENSRPATPAAGHNGPDDGGHAGIVGLVVGGTRDAAGVDLREFTGSVLIPGIGAQGGTISALTTAFDAPKAVLVPSASRQVLAAGPDIEGLRHAATELMAG